MFKVNNKNTRTKFSCFLLLTLNIFHTFPSVSVVDFEQVNVSSEIIKTFIVIFFDIRNIPEDYNQNQQYHCQPLNLSYKMVKHTLKILRCEKDF